MQACHTPAKHVTISLDCAPVNTRRAQYIHADEHHADEHHKQAMQDTDQNSTTTAPKTECKNVEDQGQHHEQQPRLNYVARFF